MGICFYSGGNGEDQRCLMCRLPENQAFKVFSLYRHITDVMSVFTACSLIQINYCKKFLAANVIWQFTAFVYRGEEKELVIPINTFINLLKAQFDFILFKRNVSDHVISFQFNRTKRCKCMQAAGVSPPCSVQPLQSVVTQPRLTQHTADPSQDTARTKSIHCHLREKRNTDNYL